MFVIRNRSSKERSKREKNTRRETPKVQPPQKCAHNGRLAEKVDVEG